MPFKNAASMAASELNGVAELGGDSLNFDIEIDFKSEVGLAPSGFCVKLIRRAADDVGGVVGVRDTFRAFTTREPALFVGDLYTGLTWLPEARAAA